MIWFFEREGARIHFEVRHGMEGPDYELVLTYPDGSERVECFEDPRGLARRSCVLKTELVQEGWEVIGNV